MFAIQSDLKILLINFLNKTTISFMFFSLSKLTSMKLSLLIEKTSTLYVFCLSFLFLLVLIFSRFYLTSFFSFRNKSQSLILWSSLHKKHLLFNRSALNSLLMFRSWLKLEERHWNTRYMKCWFSRFWSRLFFRLLSLTHIAVSFVFNWAFFFCNFCMNLSMFGLSWTSMTFWITLYSKDKNCKRIWKRRSNFVKAIMSNCITAIFRFFLKMFIYVSLIDISKDFL